MSLVHSDIREKKGMFPLPNGAEVVQPRLWMSTLLRVYKAFLSEPSGEWFFTDGLKHPGVPSRRKEMLG